MDDKKEQVRARTDAKKGDLCIPVYYYLLGNLIIFDINYLFKFIRQVL